MPACLLQLCEANTGTLTTTCSSNFLGRFGTSFFTICLQILGGINISSLAEILSLLRVPRESSRKIVQSDSFTDRLALVTLHGGCGGHGGPGGNDHEVIVAERTKGSWRRTSYVLHHCGVKGHTRGFVGNFTVYHPPPPVCTLLLLLHRQLIS